MSTYREITPLQPPYDLGLDDAGRCKVQFNLMAVRSKSSTFLEELVKILTTAAPLTFVYTGAGRNVFLTTNAKLPIPTPTNQARGPYISLIETGGTRGQRIQQVAGTTYERVTALIVVRATDYVVARTMAHAAYDAFDVVRNQVVTP